MPERYLRQVINYLIDWGHPLPTRTDLPFWVSRSDLVAADVLPPRFLTGTESHLLLVTEPAGFERFMRALSEPAPSLTIPPPAPEPPDFARLAAVAAEHGIEILGPPGIPS